MSGTPTAARPTVDFNVADVLPGVIQEEPFKDALADHDWRSYQDRSVRLTGCAPLWAYVYVAARLAPHVDVLIVDDGSSSGVQVK